MDYLENPLTKEEISKQYDATGRVSGVVAVNLDNLVERGFESVLDLLSDLLVGSDDLMDTSYELVGTLGDGVLLVKVGGDPTMVLED